MKYDNKVPIIMEYLEQTKLVTNAAAVLVKNQIHQLMSSNSHKTCLIVIGINYRLINGIIKHFSEIIESIE